MAGPNPVSIVNTRPSRAQSTISFDSDAAADLYPLKSMADRISSQVEAFAESVDRWLSEVDKLKNQNMTAKTKASNAHKMTVQLIQELKKNVSKGNKSQQGLSLSTTSQLSKSWRERVDEVIPPQSPENPSALSLPSAETTGQKAAKRTQSERSTLELLDILASIRWPDPTIDFAGAKNSFAEQRGALDAHSPGTEIWERFLLEDDAARELKLILRWLENSAEEEGPSLDAIVERLQANAGRDEGIWSRGWLNTKERLKSAKRVQPANSSYESGNLDIYASDRATPLVSQLDPDVATRQERNLEKPDEQYERSLWLAAYVMLRRGYSWERVSDWFEERNEGWRALSLGMTNGEQSSRTYVGEPYAGALWRRMCYATAREAKADPAKCAVYGVLAGDLETVEPMCRSFDDFLYAHCNAMLTAAFERYLQEQCPNKAPLSILKRFPSPSSSLTSNCREVIEKLGQSKLTSQESRSPLKVVQGALIADTFEDLVYQLGIAASKRLNKSGARSNELIPPTDANAIDTFSQILDDPEMVGLITHIYIVVQGLNQTEMSADARALMENVLVFYMDFLRKLGKVDCVPTYARLLAKGRRERVLGTIMTDVVNRDEQRAMVDLMGSSNVELPLMLHQQLTYSLAKAGTLPGMVNVIASFDFMEKTTLPQWPGQRMKRSFEINELTPEQARVVQAAEWYLFVESRWRPTFEILSIAMRALILSGNWSAALALTKRVPFHELSTAKSKLYLGHAVDVFSPDDEELLLAVPDAAPVPLPVSSQPARQSRRTTRATSRALSEQPQAEESSAAVTSEVHEQQRRDRLFNLKVLRTQSKQFLEMQQLCIALERLVQWRQLEDQLLEGNAKALGGYGNARKHLRSELDDLELVMAPILQGGYMNDICDDVEKPDYQHLLKVFIPPLLLAYNSAIVFAANYLGPETLLQSFTLANNVAAEASSSTNRTQTSDPLNATLANPTDPLDNTHLARALVEAGKMTELVESFAMSAKHLLKLNQEMERKDRKESMEEGGKKKASKRGKNGLRRRGWMGESLDLWDPTRVA